MRRATRYKAIREQQLVRAAMAAGASFGIAEPEMPAVDWHRRRRLASLFAPLLVLAPVVTSAAWFWRD